MNPTPLLASFLGLTLGLGLLLIVRHLPLGWRPSLDERIAPQMRHHRPPSALLREEAAATPWSAFARIVDPLLGRGRETLLRRLPGSDSLATRLEAAGSRLTPGDFRAQQVLMGVLGAAVSVLAAILLVSSGRMHPVLAAVLVLASTAMSVLARDSLLSSAITARRRRILNEFPSVAELFALSISAGESASGALERIATTARGDLADEFGHTLNEMRAGAPLSAALRQCARRIQLPPLERFIDGVLVAIERGTPLADVVRSQAQDVRELSKRQLMESAGRKEIHMMIPLVFGILPLTVVFAVFPGISLMNMGF